MVRASNGNPHSRVARLPIVNRLNLAQDTLADYVVRRPMIGEQEHKGHTNAGLNDSAKRPAIDIDAGLAAHVLRAELRRLCAAERMAEDTNPREIEFPLKRGSSVAIR